MRVAGQCTESAIRATIVIVHKLQKNRVCCLSMTTMSPWTNSYHMQLKRLRILKIQRYIACFASALITCKHIVYLPMSLLLY